MERMNANNILKIALTLLVFGYCFAIYWYEGNDDYIALPFQIALIILIVIVNNIHWKVSTRFPTINMNYPQIYLFGILSTIYLIMGLVDLYQGDYIFTAYNSNMGFSLLWLFFAYVARKKVLIITKKGELRYGNKNIIIENEDFFQIFPEKLLISTRNETIEIEINHLSDLQKRSLENQLKQVKKVHNTK
jgi:hypothetical protein